MAMVVKNNMSAVNTLNTLNKNQSALSQSLQKVSSGMKINSAGDDASGMAISERMRVQVRSLDQDDKNTKNGAALLRTAEGAVQSTIEVLKTLKEKAINAANDTNTDGDRRLIQNAVSGGGGDGDICNSPRGADRCGDLCRALQMTFECHIGVLLIRVDRCPEPVCVKWRTARTGYICVARALSCACARTFALTATRAVTAAISRTGSCAGTASTAVAAAR